MSDTEGRIPRKESGCDGKMKLGKDYVKQADKMSKRWNRRFTVYRCPHCGYAHLSKKIHKKYDYSSDVLHVTSKDLLTPNP